EANAKTWQFTYVGPQAVKLLGYPVKQWYEKDFWPDHIHPEDRDYTINYCQDSSQHLNDYEFDYRMIKANGDVVWLHDIVKVDRKNGEINILRGFMIDVTEQKKVEKEMHMAEEEANTHRERLAHLVRVQTLGEMASGIAHEINQPLAAINSYAEASKKHLQSGKANTGKVEELIEKISGQARRAGSVVSHLRAMMQNKISNPVALDINNLLGEAAKLAGIETKNNDCNLIFKYSRSLPRVICDGIQIQQVALNLIGNAVEAMDDIADDVEKNINVETRIKDDNYVEVCISDNGPGINAQDENNIFEAFYTTKDSGLGMGLSICKSIIENHGGELGYSQNKTDGSRFYFSLPVEK
ncbi:MAG: PAS domain-containing sensor histidine kinase, partial [Gammaproteobacteria bacterium]